MFSDKHHHTRHQSMPGMPRSAGVLHGMRVRTAWILALFAGIVLATGAAHAVKEVSDADINRAVDTELIIDEAVDANQIDVSTKEGIVTITGTVDSLLAKERATAIAEATVGVRSVVNTTKVVPTVDKSDAALRKSIENALLADAATDSFEVEVTVEDDEAILSGTVDSWQERELAATVAKSVEGIRALSNDITVDYQLDRADFEIQEEIEARLKHDVRVDDYLVEVAVKDGEVTLSGTVGSAAEKRQARNDAWVAGTESVDTSGLEVEWWARDDMRRKQAYSSMSDAEIEKAIKDAFLYDPRVLSFNPTVEVDAGVVTLNGVVDNLEAKRAAERDARNVHGVWSVANNIKVRTEYLREDTDIEDSVGNALMRDPYVNRFDITVDSSAGWVTLKGNVNTSFEKRRAERLAEGVSGVVRVSNRINYDHEWSWKPDWEIQSGIRSQLTWSPFVDSDSIEIGVDDGVVTLAGNVSTWAERQAATENAYEGGAKDVDNDLTVTYEGYGPYDGTGWNPPVY